ncbi:molybdate ABC transporter substrate-binding protein [Nitrospina gracilis]|uniref:molybdate ABC transporter substrate-binding protein n=1 Tax=Nitrospina gracilis TaxID=35801 RepID=UPI001F00C2AC|nr:molybdate ABC transporter substrate-binding protein [Nitrospina gracilis]MCF8719646.1 molybdate transport system substrate-binding protein [Nitrospina gracilis Nb-211]
MWKRMVVLGLIGLLCFPAVAGADTATVAVASNFLGPLKHIAGQFEARTGHTARIVSGSTGKLYAQILNGAPFHVFLAADSKRPRLLEDQKLAVNGSRFTYARGRLALWSADPAWIRGDGVPVLKDGAFRHLALANPKTAPYGQAAQSTLQKLGLWETLQGRIVRGENVGQAFQFAASGNAEVGFVALSQVLALPPARQGSHWEVPGSYHDPIEQDAVLLQKGNGNAAAKALLEFLKTPEVREQIRSSGYETD